MTSWQLFRSDVCLRLLLPMEAPRIPLLFPPLYWVFFNFYHLYFFEIDTSKWNKKQNWKNDIFIFKSGDRNESDPLSLRFWVCPWCLRTTLTPQTDEGLLTYCQRTDVNVLFPVGAKHLHLTTAGPCTSSREPRKPAHWCWMQNVKSDSRKTLFYVFVQIHNLKYSSYL